MPFIKVSGMSHPPMIASVGENLIVAIPETGEIRTYDLKGSFISSQKIDWAKGYVSVEEQKKSKQKP